MERETFTEGDGTTQVVGPPPYTMFVLALVMGLVALWNLLAGLAGGPEPGDLGDAMVFATVAVYALARADRRRREGI